MNKPEHQMLVLTPRRRGRPRASQPATTVCAWVPASVYDSINRIANERDISVSAVVNQVLTKVFLPKTKSS